MQLRLTREPSQQHTTLGQLWVDGRFFSFTLEDEVRAPGMKVYGQTAIPPGTYRIILNKSQRFGRMLPLVLDVPNYSGVRFHPGNTNKDTEGCILVGFAKDGDRLELSRAAMDALMAVLSKAQAAGDEILLTIQNPPTDTKAA